MLRIRTLGASEITVGDERIGPEQRSSFVLIFLLAMRRPGSYSRRELASMLWPDARESAQNHRLRSLLHRLRRLGLPLNCSEATISLGEVILDCTAFARPPRSLAEVQDRVAEIAPVLPNLEVTSPAELADRLDDARDVIIAMLTRWLRASLCIAASAGDWPLVEIVARLTLAFEESSEDAWLSLAEAQLLTSGSVSALFTLDDFAARLAGRGASLRVRLLRERIGAARLQECTLDDPPLTGRDEIMRRLWSTIARAGDGFGGSVVVWGPAGIGKTRVLREVERVTAIESVRVVRIQARPAHVLRPFGLVVEVIARLLDEPGAAGCDPEAFATLRRIVSEPNDALDGAGLDCYFDSLTELLSALAEEVTTVVLMDDMHVVDVSIWRFWKAVFRWSLNHRVSWLLSYRAHHDIELQSLPERSLLYRLPLGCLERASAERLVRSAYSACSPHEFDRFFRRVGGHPALLAAFARSKGDGEHTRSTEQIVDDWLAPLSADEFQILQTLATLGGSATTRSLLGLGLGGHREMAAALNELARLGVIHESAGVVSTYGIWADAALADNRRHSHIAISID